MEALATLISDLDRLVKARSRAGREQTFRQVVDLYFASIDLQEDEHVDFFGDVFGLLVDHVDSAELADFGQRIAPVERAPAKLIRRLANDDEISVAGPVIAKSGRLSSDDLVMLAQTKGQAHLLAISSRERIDSAVTTVLVDRADRNVIKAVARNAGAEFSTDGFARLAQRTLQDEDLAEAVGGRPDIPADVLRALVSQAAETVRARLLAAASDEMKAEIANAIESRAGVPRDLTVARQLTAELHRLGSLGEREVLGFANQRRLEETLSALELLSAMPADVIYRFMMRNAAETMPVVCKAAGLSWSATEAVFGLCDSLGRPLNDATRRRAMANFAKLTKATSEKLLRFWFVRGSSRADHRKNDAVDVSRPHSGNGGTRRPVELSASILVGGRHAVDCTIEDLSMEGARLRLASPSRLPDAFVLCILANEQISRRCEVRWRTRDTVGVQFS